MMWTIQFSILILRPSYLQHHRMARLHKHGSSLFCRSIIVYLMHIKNSIVCCVKYLLSWNNYWYRMCLELSFNFCRTNLVHYPILTALSWPKLICPKPGFINLNYTGVSHLYYDRFELLFRWFEIFTFLSVLLVAILSW